MIIYGIVETRYDQDNRSYSHNVEEYFLDREKAQLRCDEINKHIVKSVALKNARNLEDYKKRRAEYEALYAAGLREKPWDDSWGGHYPIPEPNWHNQGWWDIDEIEVIE